MRFPFSIILKKEGFTFAGVIVGVLIASIIAAGFLALLARLTINARMSKNQAVAVFLAQEGLDIVRQIRDANIHATPARDWKEGLADSSVNCGRSSGTICTVDYASGTLDNSSSDAELKRDGSGFYSHAGTGVKTGFSRQVYISPIGCPGSDCHLKIESDVSWKEPSKVGPQSIVLTEFLYETGL